MDKIVAIHNDEIFTQSQVQRIIDTLDARLNLSPQVYTSKNLSLKDAVNVLVNTRLIRGRLSSMGFIITDDQVELQIKQTESRHQISRNALIDFLKSKNINFDEYFELTREAIEFNIFIGKVIDPLISISDQDIKNEYYRKHKDNRTLAFRYNLISFSSKSVDRLNPHVLDELIKTQNIDELDNLSSNDFSVNIIGDVTEDGLSKQIKDILKGVDEGGFSNPNRLQGEFISFYIRKKDLVESEAYLREKNAIREHLYLKQFQTVVNSWYERESSKNFIKSFI